MNTSSYLKLSRHNIYIFRRRVPKALLDFFSTNELRISTKTRDKKSALHIARSIANESDFLFQQLITNKNMTNEKDLIEKEAHFIALQRAVDRAKLTNYLRNQFEGESDLRNQEALESVRRIRDLEASHRDTLNLQGDTYKTAIQVMSAHLLEKQNGRSEVLKNDLKLSELVNDYFSEESRQRRNVKPATIRKDRDSLKLFIEIVGDKYITQVSQADAVIFADALPTYGRANKPRRAISTLNGYLNSVCKFSGWITSIHSELGHIELNFSDLRTRRTKHSSEERSAFTNEEVLKILNHPKLLSFKVEEPVKYWLPYIAAYSGARLEEVTQLSPMTDIYVSDDVWIIDINEKDGRSVKNFSSIRRVPVHSELINNGFLEYIQYMRDKNATTLFPNETIRDGRTGKNAGKRANRFIQKVVGIEGKSLHSFRHTFATIMKRSGINESLAAEIMGHKHGGMTYDRYAKGYLSDTLKTAIESIKFL
jgi:integrase